MLPSIFLKLSCVTHIYKNWNNNAYYTTMIKITYWYQTTGLKRNGSGCTPAVNTLERCHALLRPRSHTRRARVGKTWVLDYRDLCWSLAPPPCTPGVAVPVSLRSSASWSWNYHDVVRASGWCTRLPPPRRFARLTSVRHSQAARAACRLPHPALQRGWRRHSVLANGRSVRKVLAFLIKAKVSLVLLPFLASAQIGGQEHLACNHKPTPRVRSQHSYPEGTVEGGRSLGFDGTVGLRIPECCIPDSGWMRKTTAIRRSQASCFL